MSTIVGSLWWLLVALGVLVTFHEFGHFWVARRFGVHVQKFSVGFGRALWSRRGKDGTEYVIAALPLGGYVKMLDEREGDVPDNQLDRAFNRKPVLARIAIVAAGPLANLVLAVALLWAMLVIGRPDYATVIGKVDGIAAQAGLQANDTIQSIDGRDTPTWSEAALALTVSAIDRTPVTLIVRNANGDEATRTLPMDRLPVGFDEQRAVEATGMIPRYQLLPPIAGTIQEGSPAWGVLAEGDRITAIDAQPVASFGDIAPLLSGLGARGGPGMIEVERDGERLALEIVPQKIDNPDGSSSWRLGIGNALTQPPPHDAVLRYGPLAAVPAAFSATWRLAGDSLGMLWRMVNGSASVRNVSGPITIARYANASAQMGAAWFLNFLALLSVSLAIINLMPIPVLDGGHLLYYLIELAIGRPLGERAMIAGQYLGLALLAGLMGLAFYNDIFHLVS